MRLFLSAVLCLLCLTSPILAQDLSLLSKLKGAVQGDYIVTAQGRGYTLLDIYSKTDNALILEEITIPASAVNTDNFSWRDWIAQGAKGNTSWIMYKVDLSSGNVSQPYSFTANRILSIPDRDNFLKQLLSLQWTLVPTSERKKSGPPPDQGTPDWRPLWQPPLIIDGKKIPNAFFNAYKTRWPSDGGEISGKSIVIFIPDPNMSVPSYFPYWMEVSGMIGKAKVRIIDSGRGIVSPKDKHFVQSLF